MGLHDRPYMHEPPSGGGGFGGMRMEFRRPGRVVGRLILINVLVVFVQLFWSEALIDTFAVRPEAWWQPWRYVTFQFLHSGIFHLFFNMIGLYFLGMILENHWGGKRFLTFYLVCGAVGGVCHVMFSYALRQPAWMPLLGASGGVNFFSFFVIPARMKKMISRKAISPIEVVSATAASRFFRLTLIASPSSRCPFRPARQSYRVPPPLR